MDTPHYIDDRSFRYYTEEVRMVLSKLEEIAGRELDEAEFRKVIEESNRTYKVINEINELIKEVPNPVPGMIRPMNLAIMVSCLGLPEATRYFEVVRDEAKKRAEKGEGVIPPEKKEIRVMHSWALNAYHLPLYHWMEETYGASYLIDFLSYFWGGIVDTSTKDSMLDGWAMRTLNFPMHRQSVSFGDVWIEDTIRLCKEMKADCSIFAGNVACKQPWAISKYIMDRTMDEVGIPTLRLEIKLCDKRLTPPDELKSRIGSFLEMVAARKR